MVGSRLVGWLVTFALVGCGYVDLRLLRLRSTTFSHARSRAHTLRYALRPLRAFSRYCCLPRCVCTFATLHHARGCGLVYAVAHRFAHRTHARFPFCLTTCVRATAFATRPHCCVQVVRHALAAERYALVLHCRLCNIVCGLLPRWVGTFMPRLVTAAHLQQHMQPSGRVTVLRHLPGLAVHRRAFAVYAHGAHAPHAATHCRVALVPRCHHTFAGLRTFLLVTPTRLRILRICAAYTFTFRGLPYAPAVCRCLALHAHTAQHPHSLVRATVPHYSLRHRITHIHGYMPPCCWHAMGYIRRSLRAYTFALVHGYSTRMPCLPLWLYAPHDTTPCTFAYATRFTRTVVRCSATYAFTVRRCSAACGCTRGIHLRAATRAGRPLRYLLLYLRCRTHRRVLPFHCHRGVVYRHSVHTHVVGLFAAFMPAGVPLFWFTFSRFGWLLRLHTVLHTRWLVGCFCC